jgi:hypothetical protein
MDAINGLILVFGSILAGLALFGAAAIRFGTDSRPTIGDDHAR